MSYRPSPQTSDELAAALEQTRLERWLLDAALAHHRRPSVWGTTLAFMGWLGFTGLLLGVVAELPLISLIGVGVVIVCGAIHVWNERGIRALIRSARARGLDPRRVRRLSLFCDEHGLAPLLRGQQRCQARLQLLSWRAGEPMSEVDHEQLEQLLHDHKTVGDLDDLMHEYRGQRERARWHQTVAAVQATRDAA